MDKINKATIEKLAQAAPNSSDTSVQVATCRFDQCKDDKERKALHADLTRKAGGVKAKVQNKAVEKEDTKAPSEAPAKRTKKTKGSK